MATFIRKTVRCNKKLLRDVFNLQTNNIVRHLKDKPSAGLTPIRPTSVPTKLPSLESGSVSHSGKMDTEFYQESVQNILKRVTGMNLDRVFATRKQRLRSPTYQLMTEEALREVEDEIKKKAEKHLEMPPVMKERIPLNVTLSEDPTIDGFDEDNAKVVFVDISTNKQYRDRRIVIREPNGVLREATWIERDTLEMIYFPRPGLKIKIPPFLRDKYLPSMFEQRRYVDVLDYVNLQCAPDSPDYLRVHRRTYDDIEKNRAYALLRSTRHYGGLVYFLVKNKIMEGILTETLEQSLLEDAIDLVKLYKIIHKNSEEKFEEYASDMKLLRDLCYWGYKPTQQEVGKLAEDLEPDRQAVGEDFLTEESMEHALALVADLTLEREGQL